MAGQPTPPATPQKEGRMIRAYENHCFPLIRGPAE